MNHFTKKNAPLIIVEILYVMFNMYYIVNLWNQLKKIWIKISKSEPKLEVPKRAGCFVRTVLYIGIDYQKFQGKSFIIILFRIILGLAFFLLNQAIKIVRVIIKHGTKSMFNAIDVVQLVLSYQIMIVWILIISEPTFKLDADGEETNIIPNANKLSNF